MNTLNRTVVAPLSSAIIAVLLAGLIVVGVDGVDRTLRSGEARLDSSGIVEISIAGAPFVRASHDRILGRHDRVRVVEGGATLELPGSSTVELRKGTTLAIGSDTSENTLLLEEGDLLVEAPKSTLTIDGGNALVSVAGAAKLRRSASLSAGAYKGTVLFHKDEQSLAVPTYRQAVAAGTGLLPADPEPLQLRATDAWDVRMLPEVLDFTQSLETLAADFDAKLPVDGAASPEVYKTVVPDLTKEPITPQLLAGRSPAENLIGLVLIAQDKGDFATRVKRVFGFRSQGASWGLVAADRGINPTPILGNLESALGVLNTPPLAASPELERILGGIVTNRARNQGSNFAGGETSGATTGDGSAPASGSPDGGSGTPTPGGGGQPTTPPGTTPPGSNPPPSNPPKRVDVPPTGSILDPILGPVIDPLESLLSGLLDGLLGTTTQSPAPASTPSTAPPVPSSVPATIPTTTTTTSPGLLGGVVKGVGGLLGGG